jgi:hypothetical protein
VKYWEIIANRLMQAGWSRGCSFETDSTGRVLSPQTHTLGMAAGSLFWQTKNSARFWNLSRLQASR